MSIVQFWRIIWARRWFVFAATVSCVIGAYVVTRIVPPRWDAHAEVLLNLLKPDPVTGELLGPGARTYVASQVALVTDYSVAGHVVDDVGWSSDPNLIAAYNHRSASDTRDFHHWLAQLVIDRTKAEVVEGSNILDITYTGTTADTARAVVDALRNAYLDTSLSLRRADANRNADWFDAQALKVKADLDAAEAAEANYERANNVYMANDTTDVDSARLAALASVANGDAAAAGGGAGAADQLAETDAEIAQLSQTLGPNHPQLMALRAKQRILAAEVARERGGASAAAANARGSVSAVESQAATVVAKSDKLAHLKQLQAIVDVRRDLYNKTVAKAADLRQQAAVADTGLTSLGAATVPAAPTFPNMPLIMFGSLGLGVALGIAVALLMELLNRRVRGPEDLQSSLDVPLLAVVSAQF